jgi:hypothetical protein
MKASNRGRYLTTEVSWSDEKNAGPVSREPTRARRAPIHELAGQPFCDGCKSWECACACSECGVKTQALAAGRCMVCHDARARHIEREQAESIQMSEMLLAQLRDAGVL